MKVESVEKVLDVLGSYDTSKNPNSDHTWLLYSCTLAKHTHTGSGRDANPSSSISLDEGESFVQCFSCGFRGGLRKLIRVHLEYGDIDENTAFKLTEYVKAESQQRYDLDVKTYFPDLPEFLVEDLNKPHAYWESRGFDKGVVARWQLGYSNDLERALIPFFDESLTLQAVFGRDVSKEQLGPKWKVYQPGFPRSKYLFGEHLLRGDEEAILLVEGPPDVIGARKFLPPEIGVLGVVTAIPSLTQLRYLLMTAPEIILGLDRDGAGAKGDERAKNHLKNQCLVTQIDYGEFKDANEAGENILEMVSNRKDVRLNKLYSVLDGLTKPSV